MTSGRVFYKALLYTLVAIIFVFTVAPFGWLVISSVSTEVELISIPPHWIPHKASLEGYKSIFFGGSQTTRTARYFKHALINSTIIAGIVTIICLFVASLSSYSFARLQFPGRKSILILILVTRIIPGVAIVIPIYIVMMKFKLLDTHLSLIVTYCSFVLPLMIWILIIYFQSIPTEIEDSARIDGCSRVGVLFRIVLPLTVPGLTATGIFSFIVAWNEFFLALILTASRAKTLPVLISEFSTKFGSDYVMMSTGGVLASIPPVILALIFQKYIIKGLTGGAVKG